VSILFFTVSGLLGLIPFMAVLIAWIAKLFGKSFDTSGMELMFIASGIFAIAGTLA
jgi:hypothetical protein